MEITSARQKHALRLVASVFVLFVAIGYGGPVHGGEVEIYRATLTVGTKDNGGGDSDYRGYGRGSVAYGSLEPNSFTLRGRKTTFITLAQNLTGVLSSRLRRDRNAFDPRATYVLHVNDVPVTWDIRDEPHLFTHVGLLRLEDNWKVVVRLVEHLPDPSPPTANAGRASGRRRARR